MKRLSEHHFSILRVLFAVGGGLLLTAAFPDIGIAGAAWIAPGLMLFSAVGVGGGQAFRLGLAGGLAHYLTSLSWLLAMPDSFHGLPVGPIAGWLALSAYCALYPALWVWLCWKIWELRPHDYHPSAHSALDHFFVTDVWRRTGWAFCAALIWVGLEMIRGRFLTGFPWNFLGVSQYKMLPLIQVAEITGVYGVSFLVIWMSVSLTIALLALVWQPGQGVLREAMLPILAVVVAMVFGVGKLAAFPKVEDTLKVVLVQPGTPQTLLFDRSDEETNFKNLLALSEEALAERTDLLVWPEGALASLTPEHSEAIAKLVTKHKVTLVACADTRDVRNDYNSALLIGPDGAIADVYHKRRLVIFGEYVPPWLSMFKWVTPIDGAFTAGKDAVQFYMTDLDVQTSVLVCFEDTFPQEAREHVTVDTDFLLNLSDDGWFGDGAEPWQHAANAAFRAVENDVPIVRCTCTGLTCWFDACGRCGGILRASDSVYGAGFLRADIPLMPEDEPSRTVYNVHGDWFGWSCLGLSAFWCAAIVRLRR